MTAVTIFKFVKDVNTFAVGETLIKEGEPGDVMYVVRDGIVDVYLGDEIIETIEENGIVGEMALIDNSPRSATAVARTEVHAVAVDADMFQRYISHTPFFAIQVMKVMNVRLRKLMERLKN